MEDDLRKQRELRRQEQRLLDEGYTSEILAIIYNDRDRIVPSLPVRLYLAGSSDEAEPMRTQTADGRGVVRFTALRPGRYRVRVDTPATESSPGYSSDTPEFEVKPWLIKGVEIRVKAIALEQITVEGPILPAQAGAPATIEGIFSRQAIEDTLLTSGRTLQSFIPQMPGVTPTPQTGTLAQFTAVGQRRYANRLTIDGINADLGLAANPLDGYGVGTAGSGALPAYGTSGSTQTLLPLDAIQEIQIRTVNAPSEHARTPGAQTAIITRAGGERHAGSGFLDVRPRGLAARDWFDNAEGPVVRRPDYWNSGATVGGPLLSQRLRYFGAWEHQYIKRFRNANALVPSLALRESASENVRPILDAYPLPNGPETPDAGLGLAGLSAQAAMGSKLWVLNARLDADLSTRHRLFGRVSRGESSGDSLQGGIFPSRETPALTFTQRESTVTSTVTLGLRSGWSSVMHELTVNATTHDGILTLGPSIHGRAVELPLNAFVPSGVSPADVMVILSGVSGSDPLRAGGEFAKSQSHVQVVDTWSLARGRHEWRLGVEYRRARPTTDPPSHVYTYNFGEVAELLEGPTPFVFLDRVLPTRTRLETWAAFVQDRFRVSRRLSLDFGLRYDIKPAPVSRTETEPLLIRFETLPDVQPRPLGSRLWGTSWTNLAPRIAASYQLCSERGRETNVSAGWSLVFDELTSPGAIAFGRGYPFVSSTVVPATRFPLPPDSLVAPPPAPFRDAPFAEAYAVPGDLGFPRTYDWRIGLEQALGASQRVGLSYVGATGRDLIYWHAYDTRRTNGLQRIHAYSNDARSNYHALLLEYVRRSVRGLQVRLNYAWSHAMDTDSGENTFPQPPPTLVPPSSNWASADFDRRHVLRVTTSYTPSLSRLPRRVRSLLGDWQIDFVGTVQTGTPVSVTSLQFLNLGTYFGTYNLRPDVVPDTPVWIPDVSAPTGRRINPDAFRVFQEPRQGTLGRNTLRAPMLQQVDAALSRSIRMRGRVVAHLRVNVYNIFNTSNFSPPFAVLGFDQFGRSYESYADAHGTGSLTQGGLVSLQQLGGPRAVQFGLRVGW